MAKTYLEKHFRAEETVLLLGLSPLDVNTAVAFTRKRLQIWCVVNVLPSAAAKVSNALLSKSASLHENHNPL